MKVTKKQYTEGALPIKRVLFQSQCDEQNRNCAYSTAVMPENKTRSALTHAGNSATTLTSLICQLFQ